MNMKGCHKLHILDRQMQFVMRLILLAIRRWTGLYRFRSDLLTGIAHFNLFTYWEVASFVDFNEAWQS